MSSTWLVLTSFVFLSIQLDEELERRKELGFRFQQTLRMQNEIFVNDEDDREKHQVNFMAITREVARLLKEYSEGRKNTSDGDQDNNSNLDGGEFDDNLMHRLLVYFFFSL